MDELKTKLAAVYAEFRASRSHTADRRRREWFVLHMTDWLDDFNRLAQLYAKPNGYSDEEAAEIVAGALYHGVTHFTAAARLLLDYAPGDIFDAIEEQPTIAKS